MLKYINMYISITSFPFKSIEISCGPEGNYMSLLPVRLLKIPVTSIQPSNPEPTHTYLYYKCFSGP